MLNMPKFWIWQRSESGSVLNMQAFHSVPNMPEYPLLDRVLHISRVLNIPVFRIGKLRRVLNMPQYGWIHLNRTWICLKMSEFTIINRLLNMCHIIHSHSTSSWVLIERYSEIGSQISKMESFGKIILLETRS